MRRYAARLTRRWRDGEGWFDAARERVRPWQALPAVLAATALIVGGFWLGGTVGAGHASAAPLTSTIKVKGKVVTRDGVRYLTTPASTVRIKGHVVHVPARTIKLAGSTEVLSGTTVDVNRTVAVPVTVPTTVNHTTVTTVVQTITVSGPTTTVTGPTTTETQTETDTVTVTVPVVSTITLTVP